MAVAALGRIADTTSVPLLVSLLDYPNKDTAMFAQGGLVRLTGQNFGADKARWAKWWNDLDRSPRTTGADGAPWPER